MKNALLNIELNNDNQGIAIYQQVADAILNKVKAGILKPGMMLPSTRKLAEQLQISRKTVVSAMDILQIKGIIVSKDRAGLFIAPEPTRKEDTSYHERKTEKPSTTPTPRISVNDGFPDTQLLPFREFSRSYRKLFNRAAQWHKLGYSDSMGYLKLRECIADILRQSRELPVETNELCIVRGAQMALFLVANAVLEKGDHIAMESPGYPRAYETFEKAGLQVHPIPVDEEGINVDQLEAICRQGLLKAVYLTPRHQYPTTVKFSMKRRKQLCKLTEEYGLLIIEDDFGAEFQFTGKHLLPLSCLLPKGQFIYIGTFSKIFAPAVRAGYMTSSPEIIHKIVDYRSLIDIQGDMITERALCELYEFGDMQRHIRKTSRIYRNRLEHITLEIKKHLGQQVHYRKPHGGLAIWLALHQPTKKEILQKEFSDKGIHIPIFSLSDGTIGLRIGYASMSNEQISELISCIAQVIAQCS